MSAPIALSKFWKKSAFLTFLANFHLVSNLNANVENRHNIFATKTAYDDAFTAKERNARESIWSPENDKQCQPVQVNMVIRHGTRYPSGRDMANAKEVVERIKGKISDPDLQNLNEWTVPFQQHEARALSPVGVTELKGLGERIVSNLDTLFDHRRNDQILLQSSNYARSIDSAKAFRSAFMKNTNDIPIEIRDDLLRYYDSCPKHIHEVEGSKDASKEFHVFKNGAFVRGVAERMKARLGLLDEDFRYGKLYRLWFQHDSFRSKRH